MLTDLPEELLEMILTYLDHEDKLFFASSSDIIHNMMAQPGAWRKFLEQALTHIRHFICVSNEEGQIPTTNPIVSFADQVTEFIAKEDDPIILHRILHDVVCQVMKTEQNHFMEPSDFIELTCSSSSLPHFLTSAGVLFLSRFENQNRMHEIRNVCVNVEYDFIADYLLLALGSYAAKQEGPIDDFFGHYRCHSEEEGEAMGHILVKCNRWGGSVDLLDDVGYGTWSLLAEAVKNDCEFGTITTSKEVIMRGGEEDLLAIWKVTHEQGASWVVDRRQLPDKKGCRMIMKMRKFSL